MHNAQHGFTNGRSTCGVWGGGVPSPPGEGAGEEAVPPPQKNFDFGSQYGEFWCILDGIFYSSATCFTRKTGVIWCPSACIFF